MSTILFSLYLLLLLCYLSNVIIDRVKDDLDASYEYLLDPDDITATITDDVIERVQDKVQEKLEKVVMERAMKKLGLCD